MKTKKKDSKKELNDKDFTLNYNEIRKAVNSFDKTFGISLKEPEVWLDPEMYWQVELERCRINLSAELVLVNGITITDYFNLDKFGEGLPIKPIGTEHPSFIEDSMLKWDKNYQRYDTDSLIFRMRFVSNVIQFIMNSFDNIIKNSCKSCKNSIHENRIVRMSKFSDFITKFILIMSDTSLPYRNILLKMHEITSYKYKKLNHVKLKNYLGLEIKSFLSNMDENILVERFYTDDMAIYQLMRLAYTLTTNEINTKALPSFKHIEGATLEYDLIKLIEELGNQIILRNGTKKCPIMFLSFLKARPTIYSQYNIESHENIAISTGIAALAYTKFVLNDKRIDKFIDEMMKKGI